ncbi:MAG: sortase [Candidatus Levybacteria bacterium]|nr:sortase [Candidatus Levybacteria bacterium]
MFQGKNILRFIFRHLGNLLILFSILGLLATFGPVLYFEIQYRLIQARGIQYAVSQAKTSPLGEILRKQSNFGTILLGPKEQILIPKDTEFSILIPKIGASARVFPNVDSSSQDEFLPILQKGIAHAKGTVFPGMKGNIYLFAHSADNFWNIGRYNAVFYLLKDLVKGDSVVVFFQNRRYNYKVEELKIVDASDVSYLVESQKQDQQTLILQTCWPPGTTWKRLVVLARPK